ncbi:hypothetical protein BC938DRAFT_479433 [Jimgerdemannia flammicorona]|uniref:Uncharacterized protein n=1 Tax=Jimgerdemannia flammicorona TaxID=994334 RepID=A0A433QKV9_9FUNG|nr:hypothetical protein BC938DRAFT_479433 [Jimgerdemannia flammicorona]
MAPGDPNEPPELLVLCCFGVPDANQKRISVFDGHLRDHNLLIAYLPGHGVKRTRLKSFLDVRRTRRQTDGYLLCGKNYSYNGEVFLSKSRDQMFGDVTGPKLYTLPGLTTHSSLEYEHRTCERSNFDRNLRIGAPKPVLNTAE